MLERGGGSIVCTSSSGAFKLYGSGEHVGYLTAKLGVLALVRHVVSRWGRESIRCNCIVPGLIVTETRNRIARQIHEGMPEFDPEEAARAANPSGRVGRPSDIAGAAAFLLSDDAAGVNAQVLHVNGGSVVGC
jgi:NAD(P)-dependent dehydrogenase (short-subunit alcohol dehydrogenase family)